MSAMDMLAKLRGSKTTDALTEENPSPPIAAPAAGIPAPLAMMLKGIGFNPAEIVGAIHFIVGTAQNLTVQLDRIEKQNSEILAMLAARNNEGLNEATATLPQTKVNDNDHENGDEQ